MSAGREQEKVTIIGAGPAGISAAVQLKRHGIDPLLLEKVKPGGLLKNAWSVENYPGFPGGIPGPRLVRLFEKQLGWAGVRVVFEEVVNLDMKNGRFLLKTPSRTFSSEIVVLATGTKPKAFPLLSRENCSLTKKALKNIYYEVYPLLKTTGKKIAIVGAGDAAFDYALNLSRHNTNTITILGRGKRVRALPLLFDRASENPNISYKPNTIITTIGTNPEERLVLQVSEGKDRFELVADHLLCALGREPQLDILSPSLTTNLDMMVSEGALYLIGDVKNKDFRQVGIAVGDGILAAMKIARRMKTREGRGA